MSGFLASASPRRQSLLKLITDDFDVLTIDYDEHQDDTLSPEDMVKSIVMSKTQQAQHIVETNRKDDLNEDLWLLTADTLVFYQDQPLAKPVDKTHAQQMLARLSGTLHQVISGVCLSVFKNTRWQFNYISSQSQIHIDELSEADIQAYIQTGEPFGKAGGYALQGHAAVFVKQVIGSPSGVIGLPLYETKQLFKLMSIPTIC